MLSAHFCSAELQLPHTQQPCRAARHLRKVIKHLCSSSAAQWPQMAIAFLTAQHQKGNYCWQESLSDHRTNRMMTIKMLKLVKLAKLSKVELRKPLHCCISGTQSHPWSFCSILLPSIYVMQIQEKWSSSSPSWRKDLARLVKALQNSFSRSHLIFPTSQTPSAGSWTNFPLRLICIWLCCSPSSPDKPAELSLHIKPGTLCITALAGMDSLEKTLELLTFRLWYLNTSMKKTNTTQSQEQEDHVVTWGEVCSLWRTVQHSTVCFCVLGTGKGRENNPWNPLPLPSCWRSCLALESITIFSTSLSKSPAHEGRSAQSTINIGLGALQAKHISWILLFFLKYALVTIQFPVTLNEFQNLISCNTEIISLT